MSKGSRKGPQKSGADLGDIALAVRDVQQGQGEGQGQGQQKSGSPASPASSGSLPPDQWKQVRKNAEKYAHWDPPEDGGAVRYNGPQGRFWTEIHQEGADGKSYHWDARRHRRNLWPARSGDTKKGDAHTKYDPDNPYQHEEERYKIADQEASKKLRIISFWVGPMFLVGSILFVLGAAADEAPGYFNETWSQGLVLGLVDIPYLVGAVFYLFGAYAAAMETANVNYRADMRKWVDGEYYKDFKKGKKASKPRIDFMPFPTHVYDDFLSYYGAQLQYLGALIYVMGTAAQLAATLRGFSTKESLIWIITPYFVGGVCFIAGAYLMAAEAAHSWWWGWLPPPPSASNKFGRWAEFLNVVGSFLFFIGGCLGYYEEFTTLVPWQVLNALTFLLGAAIFGAQSVLLTVEWIFPQIQ